MSRSPMLAGEFGSLSASFILSCVIAKLREGDRLSIQKLRLGGFGALAASRCRGLTRCELLDDPGQRVRIERFAKRRDGAEMLRAFQIEILGHAPLAAQRDHGDMRKSGA